MTAVGEDELALATQQPGRLVARLPGGDVVVQTGDTVEVASHLLQVDGRAGDLQGAGAVQRVALEQFDELAVQRGGQARGVVVPVEDVERRRLVAEQVVVDPVVPDQVVGAHPGEHLGHVLALQHAGLVGTTLGGLQSLLVGEQRDLGIQFEVEHADQLGEGVDLLLAAGHVVADQGRGGDPAGAGAEEVEVLAAGDRQDYLDGLLERLDIGGQAPFALRFGRVAPTDDEGLHAVAQAEARQALVRRQVEDVELVDLRRHHQQRAFVHRLGDRPVLDQFQHVVAEHHGALGGGQVLAHLEGVHVHLARHPAVVHQVLGQVAEAVQQALAAGLEEALDRRRVAQAVGRRHRLGQQVDDELATTDVLRRQVAVADPAVQLLAPGQVGLHVALVQRILAPGRIGKASVVIAWA